MSDVVIDFETVDLDLLTSACESYMADLSFELALEASEGDKDAEDAANFGSDMRASFKKLGKAVQDGDEDSAKATDKHIHDACHDVEVEVDSMTDEKKRKTARAIKIALIAAGGVLIMIGLTAIGRQAMKDAGEDINNLKGLIRKIAELSNKILNHRQLKKDIKSIKNAHAKEKRKIYGNQDLSYEERAERAKVMDKSQKYAIKIRKEMAKNGTSIYSQDARQVRHEQKVNKVKDAVTPWIVKKLREKEAKRNNPKKSTAQRVGENVGTAVGSAFNAARDTIQKGSKR